MAFEKVSTGGGKRLNLTGATDKDGFKHPTSVTGIYCGYYTEPNNYNPSEPTRIHVFNTEKGTVEVYGKTVMNKGLDKVNWGTKTRVTYKGKAAGRNPGTTKHDFEVEQDRTIVDRNAALSPTSNRVIDANTEDLEDTEDLNVSNEVVAESARLTSERKAKVDALLKNRR